MRELRVLHLNTFTNKDNLSYPHYQYHKDLQKLGIPSVVVSAEGDLKEDGVIILSRFRIVPIFISKLIRKVVFSGFLKISKIYFFPEWNLDRIKSKHIIKRLEFNPTVIMVYWTKLAFNFDIIHELSRHYGAEVILCPLDMAHLTGGCHWSDGCKKYESECNDCPLLPSGALINIVQADWKKKVNIFKLISPSVLVFSDSIKKSASFSGLTRNLTQYEILYTVDEMVYKPGDKIDARRKLGIDWTKKILLVGAAHLDNPRKGMSYFLSSLTILAEIKKLIIDNSDILILVIGSRFNMPEIPFRHVHLGYLETQSDLALAYRASDVFACPSIIDSGPLMINQSIMSGCPVVSFDMGVAPDLVFNYETGYRAQLKDVNDFAQGLCSMLDISSESAERVSQNCRNIGLNKFSASGNPKKLSGILLDVLRKSNV